MDRGGSSLRKPLLQRYLRTKAGFPLSWTCSFTQSVLNITWWFRSMFKVLARTYGEIKISDNHGKGSFSVMWNGLSS